MNLRFRLLVLTCVMISSCDYDITDIYPPHVKILSPKEGSVLDSSFNPDFSLKFSASDNKGLSHFTISSPNALDNPINEKPLGDVKEGEFAAGDLHFADLDATSWAYGEEIQQELELRVYDINGNFTDKSVKFSVRY